MGQSRHRTSGGRAAKESASHANHWRQSQFSQISFLDFLDFLAVIADGLAVIAEGGKRGAAAMMDFCRARFEVERLGEADQRAVIFPAADMGQPLPIAGGGIGWGRDLEHGFARTANSIGALAHVSQSYYDRI